MARRGRKPKRRFDWENSKGTIFSAISLLLLVSGVISLLSIFAGVAGGSLNSELRGYLVDGFGFVSLIIPIILFYSGLLFIGTLNWKFLNYRAFAGMVTLFIGLLGVFGSMLGGQVGGFIQSKSAEYVSLPGAVFLYFAVAVFGVVLVTNMGISTFVEKVGHLMDSIKTKLFKFPVMGEEVSGGQEELVSVDAPQLESVNNMQPTQDNDFSQPSSYDFVSPSVETSQSHEENRDFQLVKPPSAPVEDENELVQGELMPDHSSDGESEVEERTPKLPYSNKVWEYPPLSLLDNTPNQPGNAGDVAGRAHAIEETLKAFGVKASLADHQIGPAVTRYLVNPTMGTKLSKIKNLSSDLALRIKSPSGSVRIEAPVPGTSLVGIEVPNFTPSTVSLRSILESQEMKSSKNRLAIAMGHDVTGTPVIQDIAKWPHALIAGATGSGKSVMLNAIISTLLFRCSPQECRFIMIDPKLVELSQYNGIPHLLTPVVTDVEKKAVSAFAWAVSEMERRYKLFQNAGVRNLEDFNKKSGFQAEPYIVIVVDELADMMMVAASEVEKYIIRLAQKSRATGIHLILATQRPSVNILTGTIKANVPTRIAFKVTSGTDSRVVIDQAGAEYLIGRGDMLFVPPNDSKATRIQGIWVSDDEINKLVDHLKNSGIEPDYKEEILEQNVSSATGGNVSDLSDVDDKLTEALEIVISEGKASASYLQRKLGVGYSRAARMIDEMEEAGIIGGARGSKPREVLAAGFDDAMNRMKGGSDDDSDDSSPF